MSHDFTMPTMQNHGSLGRIPIAAGPPVRERDITEQMIAVEKFQSDHESLEQYVKRQFEEKNRALLEGFEEGYFEVAVTGSFYTA